MIKLHKINYAKLADVIEEVLKACDTFPQLQDLEHADIAKAVAEIYLERMGDQESRQDTSLIAAVLRKAG